MHGRIAFSLLAFSLTLGSTGCVTTHQKPVTTTYGPGEDMPHVAKKDDAPKRTPKPATEVKFAQFKEAEADSDAGKSNPEAQSRLRDEARKGYQAALRTDPNNLEATRALAGLYVKMNDFDRALDLYKKATAKHPRDAVLWYEFGLCHHRRKDLPESLRCFQKVLEIDPENRDCMKKLGFTLAWMGNYEQGLVQLTRAQGAAMAHYNIARVYVQKSQTEMARQHLMAALRENGQLAEARDLLQSIQNPTVKN